MCQISALQVEFIFISFWQMLTAVHSWWQLIQKMLSRMCYTHPLGETCTKFQRSRLIFVFINCPQLLTAIDSWWQLLWKKLNGIFMCTLKLICVPNFSSLGWFSYSSAVTTCNQLLQLLTAYAVFKVFQGTQKSPLKGT